LLKSGYTTGVHTVLAFKSALEVFLKVKEKIVTKTIKMDNDDLDVTKGCEIVVTFSFKKQDLELNPQFHNPQIVNNFEIYAGVGVGVVTKKGLKIKPNFPAINPRPLSEIKNLLKDLKTEEIYCSISVTNGEKIAISLEENSKEVELEVEITDKFGGNFALVPHFQKGKRVFKNSAYRFANANLRKV
jgi:cobalt-precorrin-5B (C1)-methyltransferase